jgi:putative ABC transport system permease protein
MSELHTPPRVSEAILKWLLRDDFDTPAGDFEEYFNQMADAHGVAWARRWYRRQVLRTLPGRVAEKTAWSLFMLFVNLKVAFRALRRHPWIASVNVAGLAVGIAACILIALHVADELAFDDMHAKADRIARVVETVRTAEGGEQQSVYTMGPLGPAMAEEIPEVVGSVRVVSRWSLGRQTVRYGDNWFYEGKYLFVDDTFFDLFDYRFIAGDPETALDAPRSVVLTESAAALYFGDENPMGRTLTQERWGDFTVTGIVEDPPPDTHLDFSMLCTLSTATENAGWREWIESWESDSFITYLLLEEGANVDEVQTRMQDLIGRNVGAEVTAERRARLQPMSDIHFDSASIDFDENRNPASRSTVNILMLVGIFILTIACINYTNMATAGSIQRAREVGLRKSVGAYRTQLVKQFLSESVVTTGAAFLIALAIAWVGLGPFNALTGKALTMSPVENPWPALAVTLLVVAVAILAGAYPALVLARFEPASVLKGSAVVTAGHNRVRKGLVVAQFTLSIGLIIASLVVYGQLRHLQTNSLGFNEEQLVVVDINSGGPRTNFRAMKDEFASDASVSAVSVSSNVPGDWKNISQIDVGASTGADDDRITSYFLGVDADFLDTFEIGLVEGRNFAAGDSLAVLLTETAAGRLGVSVGDRVVVPGSSLMGRFEETRFEPTVIGIVDDFNFRSLHEEIDPMVLGWHSNPVDVIDYFSVRIDGADVAATLDHLRAVGERFDPDHPFEFNFLDDRIQDFYVAETRLGRIFGIATALAILIACLGLFGLAAFTTARRTKEIGVRKVLGATVPGIVLLLTRDILKLVAIAFVIAAPVAWIAMDRWLESFAFRIEVGVWTLLVAGALALVFALLTVGWQSARAASVDPARSLRYE